MTLKQLLTRLQGKRVRLAVLEGQLRVHGVEALAGAELVALEAHAKQLVELISLLSNLPRPPIDVIDVRRVSYRTLEAELDAGGVTPRRAFILALAGHDFWQGG